MREKNFKFLQKQPVGLMLLLALAAGNLLCDAQAAKYKSDEAIPALQKTIRKTEIRAEQAESVLKEIDAQRWKPLPDAEGLSLKTLLIETAEHNPKARLEENQTMRAALVQDALLDSVKAYMGLSKLWLSQAVLNQELRLRQKELLLQASQFEQGQADSITLLKSQANLIETFQKIKDGEKTFAQMSSAMALNAGLDPKVTYYPKVLGFENGHYWLELPAVINDGLSVKQASHIAVKYNPQVRQLEAVRDEFRMKFLGLSTITPPGAMRLKELEGLIKQAREAADGLANKAYFSLEDAKDNIRRAYALVQLSEKAYYQIQVSFESGFASEKDIEEIALAKIKAQAAYIAATADYFTAQAELLKEMGQLNPHLVLHGLDAETTTRLEKAGKREADKLDAEKDKADDEASDIPHKHNGLFSEQESNEQNPAPAQTQPAAPVQTKMPETQNRPE